MLLLVFVWSDVDAVEGALPPQALGGGVEGGVGVFNKYLTEVRKASFLEHPSVGSVVYREFLLKQ